MQMLRLRAPLVIIPITVDKYRVGTVRLPGKVTVNCFVGIIRNTRLVSFLWGFVTRLREERGSDYFLRVLGEGL